MESAQQQQFCLKWNSFGSNLATSLSNLFKCESLADVTLFCDGVTFKAHKLILAACSKHLADLFETAPLHQNLLVILDGTSAANMAALLEFMYKGEVHVSQDALSSFLKAAECLQVKGLSIEHDKLAVAHTHLEKQTPPKQQEEQQERPSPSPYSPMSPYIPPPHYRPYDQRLSDRRPLRSPNELLQESVRASVLRDGSKAGRPTSPGPMSLAYRPSSSSSCSLPTQQEADAPPEQHRFDQETANVCPEPSSEQQHRDLGCPEDLRMKLEPMVQDEPPSSTASGNGISSPSNGPLGTMPGYENERDNNDLIQNQLWNTKHKSSSVTTPDGKKLKCPFCERLYGYETNLRAHIRQRHQGIRVPCPFCSRTFTRNNTVRRHIAREHKTELSLKAFQQSQVHNHNP
ncbi:putative metal ion binding protein [Trypoxylus dichotomus]